jgi:branched-chain amino acid transport system permease protein
MAADVTPSADNRPIGAERLEEERAVAMAAEPPKVPQPRGQSALAALKDAGLAALVALALFGPIVGMKTVTGRANNLTLAYEWMQVAVMVGAVFVGRLLLQYFVWNPRRPADRRPAAAQPVAKTAPKVQTAVIGRIAAALFLFLAFAIPVYTIYFAPDQSRYVIGVGTLILTYVMLGWGLNVVVGLAGLLDLGYVAFYAVGAYSYALIATHFGLSFWICLPIAGLLAALWGVILGFPVLRLRGDYLAIVTLAFGEIIRLVLINWSDLTNGPRGISQIPRPSFFGLEFKAGEGGFADTFGLTHSPNHRIVFLYYLILLLALFTSFVTTRIRNLPVGRAWEALREDEIACRSLGINTTNTKLTAFAIGAMFGGFAGSFFATRQGFISPESFNFLESATILAIVVLGGLGSQIGVAIAATVFIGGIEVLRNLSMLKAVFGPDFDPSNYRMLAFGLVMVAIMVWRPRGLISTRRPSVFLKERKAVSGELVGEGR